jgi:HTH-type transcriptional regulator, transcriptional repressor of NAD biosynthesis genes
MIKAFVFGKFLPFHKGHEAMINFALDHCDLLTVLVCCSDKENIPGKTRKKWIEQTFEHNGNAEVKIFDYREEDFPNTSVSSESVSKIWANIFTKEIPGCSLLITSEPYGDYVASFMNIQHIPFDINRTKFPVASSFIREDIFSNWQYLPASVKPYYAIKVVLLGTESTGKTTLAQNLSAHYTCSVVLEAARDIIDNSNDFSFDDLQLVAKEHARQIEKALQGNSPLIIIDTDIHITKSYAEFVFGSKLDVSEEICKANKADLYLYLTNEADFFQDGTRLEESERNQLDLSHRKILAENGVSFVEISGTWNERFEKAVSCINKLISKK